MKKILIIRFSSIGDIVLTSAVVRCLKQQLPGAEIHYVTKKQFTGILDQNPYIDKVFSFQREVDEIMPALKEEDYDFIVDLHKNLRSWRVILGLRKPWASFPKLNARKLLLTALKIQTMPQMHIVNRYFRAVKSLGVTYDGQGLDYFINEGNEYPMDMLPESHRNGYVAFVIGAKHATKQLPLEKLTELCQKIKSPLILLGGSEDKSLADEIIKTVNYAASNSVAQSPGRPVAQSDSFICNLVGKLSLSQSASLVKQSKCVITHDTGLMHIAAAYHKPILSVWGNTVPEFGMYPFFRDGTQNGSVMMEVKNLPCRPCSKIGFRVCPKGHFRCMTEQDTDAMASWVQNT